MKLFACMMLAAMTVIAADATGNWSGTMTFRKSDGTEGQGPALLVLKQEGSKLTGTAGPDAGERHTIENGKVEDTALTFEVPNNGTVMTFVLTQQGEEISGEITRERNGEKQVAKLALKREK